MDFVSLVPMLISSLLGGSVVGFVEFMIRRHDERNDKQKEVLEAIAKLDEKIEALERKVDTDRSDGEAKEIRNTRNRILRFDDEIREKRLHSLEHFQEILRDCDDYENYCEAHPKYENSYAVDAIENIKKMFRKCKDENSFI